VRSFRTSLKIDRIPLRCKVCSPERAAVYRTEVEKLAAAQRNFAETMPPIEALRAWMLLFVDYIAAKKIIAPALNTLIGDPKRCSKLLTHRSGKRCARWRNAPSKAATYVKTLTLSISFAL